MKSCSLIGLHSVTWPNITLLWCWWCCRWKKCAIPWRHWWNNALFHQCRHRYAIDQSFSSIVCEKCYRYRLHRPLCKSCPPRYIACAAIVNKQQNCNLRGIADEDIRWRDIKQIYHALFRATSEIMDSSVSEIALFSSGLRPSEIPATSESIISTRASQCMVYLFTIQYWQ